jgi:hypothetical protein
MLNHSCAPNTFVSFQGRALTLFAAGSGIAAGAEVTHCYGPQQGEMVTEARWVAHTSFPKPKFGIS